MQLINSPPPALYPSFGAQPVFGAPGYPAQMPPQAFSATTFTPNPYAPPNASTSPENNTQAPVLPNQPQPFVMPLGPPPMAAPPTYTVYPPRYPATSYYQYPTSTTGYYAAPPTQNAPQPTNSTNTTTTTTTPPTNPANPPHPATATTTPTMAHTNVPTNPNTGTPTQAPANPANPANPWPTGYNQVGTCFDGVPNPFYSLKFRANGQTMRLHDLNILRNRTETRKARSTGTALSKHGVTRVQGG
jgi:hypothetical protein